MELLRGTMVRHSLIAHPPGSSIREEDRFDGVPIRLPDTVTVDDRLPPGAAAVLINTTHTDPDLVLPVDEGERRFVEMIDGTRSVDELAAAAEIDPDVAVALAQRLYWWDQIVADCSSSLGFNQS
jgi:hypothetical protein